MSAGWIDGPVKCGKTREWWQQMKGLLLMLACTLALSSACAGMGVSSGVESEGASQAPQIELEAVLVAKTQPDRASMVLQFTLVNHSEIGLYVLEWYTPLEGVFGEIFRVERDGQVLPYEGPLVMRGDPTQENYVWLERGASVAGTVDLADAYDFSQPGMYTISFISPRISDVARTWDQMAMSVDQLGPVQMRSKSVVVQIRDAAGG
jgi:hypothetical protein